MYQGASSEHVSSFSSLYGGGEIADGSQRLGFFQIAAEAGDLAYRIPFPVNPRMHEKTSGRLRARRAPGRGSRLAHWRKVSIFNELRASREIHGSFSDPVGVHRW